MCSNLMENLQDDPRRLLAVTNPWKGTPRRDYNSTDSVQMFVLQWMLKNYPVDEDDLFTHTAFILMSPYSWVTVQSSSSYRK